MYAEEELLNVTMPTEAPQALLIKSLCQSIATSCTCNWTGCQNLLQAPRMNLYFSCHTCQRLACSYYSLLACFSLVEQTTHGSLVAGVSEYCSFWFPRLSTLSSLKTMDQNDNWLCQLLVSAQMAYLLVGRQMSQQGKDRWDVWYPAIV